MMQMTGVFSLACERPKQQTIQDDFPKPAHQVG